MEFDLKRMRIMEIEDPFVGNFDSTEKEVYKTLPFPVSKREKAERIIREMESSYQKLNHLLGVFDRTLVND